MVARVTYRR